jgi:chromosomal replication initiation ATPase DnaA
MFTENHIDQVRPGSTFDSYRPSTPQQAKARNLLLEVAKQLRANVKKFAELPPAKYGERTHSPFPKAGLISLWGGTGTGKTHLMEALVNYQKQAAPAVYSEICLSRKDFTIDNMVRPNAYEGKPVVLVDDLYSKEQGLQDLSSHDIKVFMEWVGAIYESRRLVILTSNFSILGPNGIEKKVKEMDKIGRVTSRLTEMLAGAKEAHVDGPDHRLISKMSDEVSLFDEG